MSAAVVFSSFQSYAEPYACTRELLIFPSKSSLWDHPTAGLC